MIATQVLGKQLADTLLLPPGGPLLLAAFGLAMLGRWPRGGRRLAAIGLVLAWLSACDSFGDLLAAPLLGRMTGLEPAVLMHELRSPQPPQAIVVLSGGQQYDQREQPDPAMLRGASMARTLLGGRLARQSGLPVLVSGGSVSVGHPPEARTMARMLSEDLNVRPRWIESGSHDTAENAARSAVVLREAGIQRIVLVTDATHMPRARRAFEEAGLAVLAAPVSFPGGQGGERSLGWLPSAKGAGYVSAVLHEWAGLAWYRIRDPVAHAAQARASHDTTIPTTTSRSH